VQPFTFIEVILIVKQLIVWHGKVKKKLLTGWNIYKMQFSSILLFTEANFEIVYTFKILFKNLKPFFNTLQKLQESVSWHASGNNLD
jgi:hypothetical protein